MLKLKEGRKQLRQGVLDNLAEKLEVHRSELTARMKFAAKFPTDEELTNVISKFPTWFAIKQQALTTTKREPKARNSGIRRVLELVENIDAATLGEGDGELLAAIEVAIQRIKTSIVTLKQSGVTSFVERG